MGRTEITFVTPAGYNTGLTPMSFGSSIDYWTKNATSPMMLRSPQKTPSHRGWVSTTDAFPTYIATDAFPLRSWAEGALGLLNFNVGLIKFTADAPVVVRMYNVKSFDHRRKLGHHTYDGRMATAGKISSGATRGVGSRQELPPELTGVFTNSFTSQAHMNWTRRRRRTSFSRRRTGFCREATSPPSSSPRLRRNRRQRHTGRRR
jgi:hypothetical protein